MVSVVNSSVTLVAASGSDQASFETIWCVTNAQSLGFPFQPPFIDMLKMQFAMKSKQYQMQYPLYESLIITLDNENVGYIWFSIHEQVLTFIDIEILPQYQNKGIGKESITQVLSQNSENIHTAKLSVLKTNDAYHLYIKLGFSVFAEDEMYWFMEKRVHG